jgi:adenylosuccinate synthase
MIDFADVIVDVRAGDCGKGKVAVQLTKTSNYTHCLRFSGSNNAGHTIYHNGKKIVGHCIPMGIVNGIKSIIGSGCVINIKQFFQEIDSLEKNGINTKNLIFISKNTHIITDSHIEEDCKDTKIGTTKKGNGQAYRDKYDRKGIRAEDIPELKPFLIDLYDEFHSKSNNVRILCEGAQGFELDIDWGDYPYVTSSHCNVGSATLNAIPPKKIRNIYAVAKIYDTYVGNKQFQPKEEIFNVIADLGKEFGSTTGRKRQCNWLNLDSMIKGLNHNGATHLIVNKCDILKQTGIFKLFHEDKLIEFKTFAELQDFIDFVCYNSCDLLENIFFSGNPETIEGFEV